MIAYSGRKRKKNTIILQKVHNLIGLQHTEGLEIQSVSGQKLEFDAVPEAFLGQAVAGSVEVAVVAFAHIVLLQQFQDGLAGVAFVTGRVVEKYHFR